MTADAELLRGIYALTGGELDGAGFRLPELRGFLGPIDPIRITGTSRFWCDASGTVVRPLHRAAEDLLCGLHGQQGSLVFLVESRPPNTHFWIGASTAFDGRASLKSSLGGAYPDVRLDGSEHFDAESIGRYSSALAICGVPTRKANAATQADEDQIESLCRGLAGQRWLFAVRASAIPAIETLKASNDIATRIRDVQSTFLLKNSAADQENRLAKRFVELLEIQHARFEQGQRHGMWAVQTAFFSDDRSTLGQAKGLLMSAYGGNGSSPSPIRAIKCERNAANEAPAEALNSGELAVLTRLSKRESPGYTVFEHTQFGLDVPKVSQRDEVAIQVGSVIDHEQEIGQALEIARADLAKHAFVVGVTGSGKTNTCFSLLEQIWRNGEGVPFLVIEPAKSEYRRLLSDSRIQGLRVFTVADETVSPLRLNPLYFPTGVLAQSHIDLIKALFGAAFVLYPPMPYVLEQSLQEIYIERGWELASNTNRRGDASNPLSYPTLSDLARKIVEVVDRMGYDERLTMDIKAGLLARVSQLCRGGGKGRMLDTRTSIPFEVLFDHPCLLELKQMVSDEEKAFVMGLILIFLYEYRARDSAGSHQALRHVTLIEEAHRLLRNTSTEQGSEVHANPRGHAIEVFGNILSEIRAYGEGMLIAEQIPSKLAPDVVKNTNLKIVHRLVADDDRRLIGAAMNLDETQQRFLATLGVGDAAVYAEPMRKAVLVRMSKSRLAEDASVSTDTVRRRMSSFLADNERHILSHRACQPCSTRQRQQSECRSRLDVDIDANCERAFGRVFNAIRLNKALVWEAFGEFVSSLASQKVVRGASPYCVTVGLTNRAVELRGSAGDWAYSDVQGVIDAVCESMRYLCEGYGVAEREGVESAMRKQVRTAYQLLDRLDRVKELPYPGCRVCAHACRFRFDMSMASSAQIGQEFDSAILDADITLDVAAGVCWDATEEFFMHGDIHSRRGATLCFAVQQFSRMGMNARLQEEWASDMSSKISRIG